MGGSVENDHNVLTGGPVTGTSIQDLPPAVKTALKRHAPDGEIADIDKLMRGGRVVYEISFTEPAKNPKLFITADGRLLSNFTSFK